MVPAKLWVSQCVPLATKKNVRKFSVNMRRSRPRWMSNIRFWLKEAARKNAESSARYAAEFEALLAAKRSSKRKADTEYS